jgi:hypothetical protein
MRRLVIALGAAVAALATASSALPCSPLPAGTGTVRDARVVADAADRAFVSWERQGEQRVGTQPRAVALGDDAGWTWADPIDAPAPASVPVVTYPALGASAVVGLGAGGHAVAVWRTNESVPEQPGVRRRGIRAADRGPDGVWSPEYTISSSDSPIQVPPTTCFSDTYGGPAVAVDGAGNAVAAWVARDPDPVGKALKWAARPSGGAWSAPITLGPPGEDLDLAVDASGAALLTWIAGGQLHAAVRPAGGSFGPSQALGPASRGWLGFGGIEPSVTVDPSGRALAVWASGADQVVAAARSPGGAWSAPVDLSAIAESPPALISEVRLTRQRLRRGATALTFRMRAAGEVVVTLQRRGRGPAVRGVKTQAGRGLNRVALLRRPLPPGAYTVRVTASAKDWAPASRAKRVVVLPRD